MAAALGDESVLGRLLRVLLLHLGEPTLDFDQLLRQVGDAGRKRIDLAPLREPERLGRDIREPRDLGRDQLDGALSLRIDLCDGALGAGLNSGAQLARFLDRLHHHWTPLQKRLRILPQLTNQLLPLFL